MRVEVKSFAGSMAANGGRNDRGSARHSQETSTYISCPLQRSM
jgi:hypothetical protein